MSLKVPVNKMASSHTCAHQRAFVARGVLQQQLACRAAPPQNPNSSNSTQSPNPFNKHAERPPVGVRGRCDMYHLHTPLL
eukprot:1276923-Amphidinium_carterae.1